MMTGAAELVGKRMRRMVIAATVFAWAGGFCCGVFFMQVRFGREVAAIQRNINEMERRVDAELRRACR